jgi:methionyl-tRNA formyltransferase
MKIALLIDNLRIAHWQALAAESLPANTRFLVYNCLNTPHSPRRLRHGLYYLLNLFTIRNSMTRRGAVTGRLGRAEIVDFESEIEGAWQQLPDPLLDRISADRPDVILKFGMGLLRIPEPERLSVPLVSYHHGDPEHFRGRPAGFYELLQGRQTVGQIVQILSNRLDAGEVLAFAETKAHAYSYRRTLIDGYRHSPLLLKVALDNLVAGQRLPRPATGKNYRLPGNLTVLKFVAGRAGRLLRRLFYGAFFEKEWRVSTAQMKVEALTNDLSGSLPAPALWNILAVPRRYVFLADPFFAPDGDGLLVEALNRRTDRGEIVRLSGDSFVRLSDPAYHHSYPSTLDTEGRCFVVPEMSDRGPQRLFLLRHNALIDMGELDIEGRPRLLDPTLFPADDRVYLFANRCDEGDGVLRLWSAQRVTGPFVEHPESPVLISPYGARMAGSILSTPAGVYRLGQDLRAAYGDGVVLHKIETLTPTTYREIPIGEHRFTDRGGPHTIQVRGAFIAFDWYVDRFNPIAGLRRLRRS